MAMRVGVDAEPGSDLSRRGLGHRDHGVRPPRVRPGQSGVVAANFGPGVLRRVQKVQVVHRDDLRGALRGHEERVHRVHDVDVAGERFDGRPLEAMPRQVEKRDRNPGIDDRRARDDAGREPVLPGAGEEHQAVAWRQAAGQRASPTGARTPRRLCALAGRADSQGGYARAPMLTPAREWTANPFRSIA